MNDPSRPVPSTSDRRLSRRRTPLRLALALLLAAGFAALTVAPAQAASYRFWGFYSLADGTWQFAQKGSDQTVPAEGAVEGWRFAVGDESASRLPRATATFDQLCASTPAQDGSKRVGVIVDFGRAADADADAAATPPEPKAVCAVVPTAATSTDVLRVAGEVRMEKGLVCGVGGYPASGCGGEVKEVSAEAKAADTPVTLALPSASSSAGAATPSSTPTDAAVAPSTSTAATSSGAGTTIAYIVAGLVLIAVVVLLVLRSRSAARRGNG